MKLPKARKDIIVQDLKGEVLVYDLETDRAHCLNETAGKVFNACDGMQTLDDLKRRHRLTDEIIFLALDSLKKENLLDETTKYVSPFAGVSRREAVRKVGLASLIALPVISSLLAPTAAAAQSRAAACNSCTNSLPLGSICSLPFGCFSQTGLAGITTTGCATSGTTCRTCTCQIPGGQSSCSSVCA